MKQCFPAYAEELPELMRALKTVVEERFNEAVPVRSPLLFLSRVLMGRAESVGDCQDALELCRAGERAG